MRSAFWKNKESVFGTLVSEALFLPSGHRMAREVEKTMYVITFRSVTYAQRAEQLLKKAGFRCYLQRTPAWINKS